MPIGIKVVERLRKIGRKVDLILNNNKSLGWAYGYLSFAYGY